MEGGALVIFFIFVFVLTRKIYTHLVAILKFCLELPSLLGLYIYSSSGEVDCFPC
jgi:hypothetical protein